jgi:hypothetical protein
MKKIFASEMTGAFHGPDAPHGYSPQGGKYFAWPGHFLWLALSMAGIFIMTGALTSLTGVILKNQTFRESNFSKKKTQKA